MNTNKGKNKCASKGGISTQDLSMDKYGTLVNEDHEIFSYGIPSGDGSYLGPTIALSLWCENMSRCKIFDEDPLNLFMLKLPPFCRNG